MRRSPGPLHGIWMSVAGRARTNYGSEGWGSNPSERALFN